MDKDESQEKQTEGHLDSKSSGEIKKEHIGSDKQTEKGGYNFYFCTSKLTSAFLCQLTCQSADIMSSLCGVGVRVRVNNFSSKTTRPRDMLFF